MTAWTLHPVPADGDYLVFGVPYAGTGAASFKAWPRELGTGRFCAVQPPGRENRFGEDHVGSHQEFAEGLVAEIADHLDRPYALIGHCGAVPFLLQIAAHLEKQGLPTPRRLFASGWGAPHQGLYGRLNFVDLDEIDMTAEIEERCTALGYRLPPEFLEIAAETLLADVRLQRGYRAEALPSRKSRLGDRLDRGRCRPRGRRMARMGRVRLRHLPRPAGRSLGIPPLPRELRDLVERDMSAAINQ